MNLVFDIDAPKKPTNVSINSDLLIKAKALKINLSKTLEAALVELINIRQRELWKNENQVAIKTYNLLVEEHGIFSNELRHF
ncbi:acetoacetyl-CoA synthase [Achromatium sp. WMS3]|nr:acetoacetyl-CoA synthase [Achromatium sp. WMS1]KOR30904.1 acetoacetyl-CoA synthase [Achromatium sp. WMS3]